jgi:hypothetical protein
LRLASLTTARPKRESLAGNAVHVIRCVTLAATVVVLIKAPQVKSSDAAVLSSIEPEADGENGKRLGCQPAAGADSFYCRLL